MTNFVSFDLESTGRQPHSARVMQAATVGFHLCAAHHLPQSLVRWQISSRFHTLVDPGVPIPPQATAIHGFRDGDVAGSMTTASALAYLLPQLRDQIVVGYNLCAYDLPLFQAEADRNGMLADWREVAQTLKIVDLYQWIQAAAPRQRKRASGMLSLTAQCAARGIEQPRTHDAVYDAEVAGWLCVEMLADGSLSPLEEAAAATAGTWKHLL